MDIDIYQKFERLIKFNSSKDQSSTDGYGYITAWNACSG